MKLTEKEQKLARLALDKGCQPGERQNAAAKLIESLYARGVKVEDIETQATKVEYRDQVQTVYRDRVVVEKPVHSAMRRASKPHFQIVPQVLPFKTPTARENARLRCVAMLQQRDMLEVERVELSNRGQFSSAASIDIHWQIIKLQDRLTVTAQQAGLTELVRLLRTNNIVKNDLLRATGWIDEVPAPIRAEPPVEAATTQGWQSEDTSAANSEAWSNGLVAFSNFLRYAFCSIIAFVFICAIIGACAHQSAAIDSSAPTPITVAPPTPMPIATPNPTPTPVTVKRALPFVHQHHGNR